MIRDVPYGARPEHRFDVYLPARAQAAPVIFLVHGGGWERGDKAHGPLVENKVAHWVGKGFVLISTNYRMLPEAQPDEQARDVARAFAAAQQRAAQWGADPRRYILMGHSAGAHLAALLASSPTLTARHGVSPWLGTVLLDSAVLDVVQLMEQRHLGLFDDAFGADPLYWPTVSPYHLLQQATAPLLAVCSSQRAAPCPDAQRFAAKAVALGSRVEVQPEDLGHGEINRQLGLASPYTARVDSFLRSLDAWVAHLLSR
ncbi:esterase [Caldimonas brevitalea]|uniref:Esterase n=1 Tax=Caldimonas brevitalea TaxID=413882 RepID=A0A0G3BWR9_9BURK|nr:esterase [Caldimonas brevitalea]